MLGATALGFVSPKGLPISGFHARSKLIRMHHALMPDHMICDSQS